MPARRALLLVAVAALLASGCRLQLRVGVDVDRSGGGVLRVDLAADTDLLERAQAAGVDPLARLAEDARARAAGRWRVVGPAPSTDGSVVSLRAGFDDPAGLTALSTELASALAVPEVSLLTPFAAEVTEDTVTVTGAAGLEPGPAVADLGLSTAAAVEAAGQVLDYEVVVRLPAEVVETDADRVEDEGGRAVLTWDVAAGATRTVRAVGVRPPGLPLPLLVGGAVLGAAALALLLVVPAIRRRA